MEHMVIMMLTVILLTGCNARTQDVNDFSQKRAAMVSEQIMARGVKDKQVLDAMLKVERHLFVPPDQAARAYNDYPLPIGYDQTISQPYIVAFMSEALQLKPGMKVLEIGTGSGYQAAVLAEMGASVYSVEIVNELAEIASQLLNRLGYTTVKVKSGDGYLGWPEHSPYQAVIVTCSPTHIPQPLIDQMDEGGRMIIPVGQTNYQELILLEKKNGKLYEKSVLPVRFVPMVNEQNQNY